MSYPCVICGAELYETDTVAVCSFCGRETPAEYLCPNGHHICEDCQLADPLQAVERVCEGTRETNPGVIVNLIMKHPVMVMHSPYHHVLVAPAVLAALSNSGQRLLKSGRLASAIKRTADIPYGVCGARGECGAAVGVGALISILTGASYLKDQERSLALRATAEALQAIAEGGGPRCCKQSVYLSLETAGAFLRRDGITDAHHHFAVEEALVRLVDEGVSPPTLRLRQVRRAVFVGVFQDTWAEVDVDYCRQHGIKIVRRANAGGAVYHDLGSSCYSAFFPRTLFPQSEEELYRLFAGLVIRTCADYDVTAHFHGRNDVLVGERKIYGSAQITWYDTFMQSGTFLVNMDFDVMDQALTPPALKFADKPARSVKERVTLLAWEVGRELDTDEVMERFAANFTRILGIELAPDDLTPGERKLANEGCWGWCPSCADCLWAQNIVRCP